MTLYVPLTPPGLCPRRFLGLYTQTRIRGWRSPRSEPCQLSVVSMQWRQSVHTIQITETGVSLGWCSPHCCQRTAFLLLQLWQGCQDCSVWKFSPNCLQKLAQFNTIVIQQLHGFNRGRAVTWTSCRRTRFWSVWPCGVRRAGVWVYLDKEHSGTVMVWNYQTVDCSLKNKLLC